MGSPEPDEFLRALLKKGPSPAGDESFTDPGFWAEKVKLSSAWVFGGTGSLVADRIEEIPGFFGFEKMLDLGCGHGVFSLYLMERNPGLTSVLLDREPVLKAAAGFVEAQGAEDRVSYLPGDYMTVDIGAGYDLIYASATLNFVKTRLAPLFSKIFAALKPGGWFVSFQDGMTHEQTRPDTMLEAVIPSMQMGLDLTFDQGDIAQAMVDCGFSPVRSRTLETPMGQLDMDMARKPG